jgi:hypothetical protein
MKLIRFIILAVLPMFWFTILQAQNKVDSASVLRSATSAEGNYIYMWRAKDFQNNMALVQNTKQFIVEKFPYATILKNGSDKNPKTFEVKPVANIKELKELLKDEYIDELKKMFKLTSNQELVQYFQTKHNPNDFGILYSFIEIQMAMGHVFFDKKVDNNELFLYRNICEDNSGSQHRIGYAAVQSKVGNYWLSGYKPKADTVHVSDSSLVIKWKMIVNENGLANIKRPKSLIEKDVDGSVFIMPFSPTNLWAHVMVFENGKWIDKQRLFPLVNASADTITYAYFKRTVKDEELTAHLVMEDEVHNMGASSDTVYAICLTSNLTTIIDSVKLVEIVNGIHLSWRQLPNKQYYTGIQIIRENSGGQYDTVALLSKQDTSFTDYKISVGQHYTYNVKALFIKGIGLEQVTPAQAAGTFNIFSKPLPPYNLKAATEGKSVRLQWQSANEPGFYGYYIYRGTSPKKIKLLRGPIADTTFLDTIALNGRTTFYYAIMQQNLRQDTSELSAAIGIKPNKSVEPLIPGPTQYYMSGSSLIISWGDARVNDNEIVGYTVRRKLKGERIFVSLSIKPIEKSMYLDSPIVRGNTYEYQVASISFTGDTSAYNEVTSFTADKEDIETINLFYARNIDQGIKISIPAMTVSNRKQVVIYRRKANEDGYTKLTSLTANQFDYIDKSVEKNAIYVYALSIVLMDDREGNKGDAKSIRRN